MKLTIIPKSMNTILKFVLAIAVLFSVLNSNVYAQYSNGPLSTGATATGGTAAPAGFTWSEVQGTNVNAGFSASVANGFAVADDFTVPCGQSWNVTKFTFYAYSTGYAGATSPFNDTRVRIFNTNPSIGTPAPIFGDLTTNRFSTSTSASMYRIFNATPGTTRIIWKIEATVVTTLAAGTYWVEWQHNPIVTTSSNFTPAKTVVGLTTQPGDNALQHTITGNTWAAVTDGTPAVPQDFPFDITYTNTGAVCTGTPAPGNTISNITTGCAGANFNLSLQNASCGTGITYQWQTSPTLAGTYTNIAGATAPTYIGTVTTGGFYRCLVTCTASASTGTSAPVQVALTPASGCYCTPTPSTFGCNSGDLITNVTMGGINNTSACPTTTVVGYSNYTSLAPGVILRGAGNPISVNFPGGFTEFVSVWVDYDKNGSFDPSEYTLLGSSAAGGPLVGTLNAPATAQLGTTRMRVKLNFASAPANTSACTGSGFGEIEDYTVDIQNCVPLTITTQPASTSVTCGGNATFTVGAAGSFPSYQWQIKSASGVWLNLTNTAPYSGVTTTTLTVTGATTALNGNQYRAIYTGACSGPDFSNTATLTINPIVAVVNPASATLCQGGIQQLTITNIASPAPGSTVVNSATLNLNVPDNNVAGINSSITIPALPAGAVVVGARVRLNVASTWLGDLNVNLRAPNNQILNLSHNLSVTNGNLTGGGSFVNTVIGSTFTTPLHTTTSPDNTHTGNYKADAGTATVSGISPNITGFVPTTASWNSLFSTPAGTWTIAIADIFGGADVTTFQNWSLTIDYLLGSPATGVFTGPTGTIFTNAAATVPYTGTAVNTVYVLPTTSGVNNYSVVVTDAACSSLPLTIPVTMYAPVTASTPLTLANATICANTNTSFALGGTLAGGPGISHQFQVRTPGSTTWSNIANGAVYGGATTSTLTLTAAPASFNGNQYRDSIYTPNGCGFLLSPVATLTVNATPVVTISAAPVTSLFPGLTSTLTAAVSPNAAATYQWLRNGVAVPGATLNKYVVTVDALGTYTVRVSDVNGCVNAGVSTPASITISDSSSNTLFIYPSPNTGQFQVRYYTNVADGSLIPGVVNVYDEKGARVFTKAYTVGAGYQAMNVDLGIHGKGVYRVDLITSTGERIKTGTVMVF